VEKVACIWHRITQDAQKEISKLGIDLSSSTLEGQDCSCQTQGPIATHNSATRQEKSKAKRQRRQPALTNLPTIAGGLPRSETCHLQRLQSQKERSDPIGASRTPPGPHREIRRPPPPPPPAGKIADRNSRKGKQAGKQEANEEKNSNCSRSFPAPEARTGEAKEHPEAAMATPKPDEIGSKWQQSQATPALPN